MISTTTYVVLCLLAWPVLVVAFCTKLNHLRRGPSFRTVAVVAALLALVWPLAVAGVFLIPPGPGPGPVICLDEALAEYVAALLTDASLTPAQRDQLAALLRPAPRTPGPRSPRPVASACSASLRFSAGASPHPTPTTTQRPAQPPPGGLRRSGFGATHRGPS